MPNEEKPPLAAKTYTQEEVDAITAEKEGEASVAMQARCKNIVTAEAADGRTAMAHHLAFETPVSADDSIALLEKTPKAAADTSAPSPLAAAMHNAGTPGVGDGGGDGEPSAAQAIVNDFQSATGALSH